VTQSGWRDKSRLLSWKRLGEISGAKFRLSRQNGFAVPRSGRQKQIDRMVTAGGAWMRRGCHCNGPRRCRIHPAQTVMNYLF